MSKYSPASFSWPLEALPQIYLANRYPMDRKAFSNFSWIDQVALHQHEYPGEIRLGSRRFILAPGDVTLTPPKVPYAYNLPCDGEHLCIQFYSRRSTRKAVALPLHLRLGGKAPYVREKFNHIIAMFRLVNQRGSAGLLARQVSSVALQELLLWLALQKTSQGSAPKSLKAQDALDHLMKIIDTRLGEMPSIPDLAAEVGLSQDYLAKIFQRIFGSTLPHYILRRRIDVAQHLLLTTPDPIWIIAARVGLPDPQYFNKQFRRFTGVSPSERRWGKMLIQRRQTRQRRVKLIKK